MTLPISTDLIRHCRHCGQQRYVSLVRRVTVNEQHSTDEVVDQVCAECQGRGEQETGREDD